MTGWPILTAWIFNSRPKLQTFSSHPNIILEGTIISKLSGQFDFVSFGGRFGGDIETLNPPGSSSRALGVSSVRITITKSNGHPQDTQWTRGDSILYRFLLN